MKTVMASPNESELFEKIRNLPPDKVSEVEDFVDFLKQKAGASELSGVAAKLAEASFARAWDNADDAEYDQL